MSFESDLKAHARALGFDDIGIAQVDGLLPYIEHVAQAQEEGRFGPLDYLDRTLSQRLDLQSFFPDAQSVVVVVKNYYTGDHPQTRLHQPKIARYAWGQDYHHWFKKKLKLLAKFMDEHHPNTKVWQFNDTGPFLERAWAHKAGLGFIGKSAMFIHRDLGTWTFLGGLATNIALKQDQSYRGPDCGSCTRCIDACPPKAIIAPHKVDANKCISTWTIERTLHPQSKEKAPRNHEWAFGCDICQEVCPWNKFEKITDEPRFQPKDSRVFLSQATLKEDLRGSPLYRTKKIGLITNWLRIKKTLRENNAKKSADFFHS